MNTALEHSVAAARLSAEIEAYWDERSEAFSKVRLQELNGPDGRAWWETIAPRLPAGKKLRVLDIGTGAGFFAILLGKAGHEVTAIDQSGSMLHHARENVLACGTHATFRKMDAQKLLFPDNSFDLILSRNLTWTLPDALGAYREWLRVLKKGGLLLNFDSDCGRCSFEDTVDTDHARTQVDKAQVQRCNAIKEQLSISTCRRPYWDLAVLQELGCECSCEEDISGRVHLDPGIAYDNIPLFAIYARKK